MHFELNLGTGRTTRENLKNVTPKDTSHMRNDELWLDNQFKFSTMFHHVCVVLFFVQNYFDDYSNSSVCRLIMLYAMFSSAAFYINLLLALRHVYDLSYRTYTVAFWTFLTTTLVNWFVQLQLMARVYPISLLFYLFPLMFVVNDDIILLQWLLDRATITN